MIENDIINTIKETKRDKNHYAITKSYQMPSICKINKLINIYINDFDKDNLNESCENFINVTYNAIKSAGVKELCI